MHFCYAPPYMPSTPELKRTIGLRDLALFYVVSGLSIRWTATAAAAGPSILVIWIAALIGFFLPLAGSVMELSSRYPQEGGIYIWTREAFGDFCGFITAWTYWMSNLPYFPGVLYFGAASMLFAFGSRGAQFASSPGYFISFAIAWLAVITVLNILGTDAGKWLNNFSSLGSLLPLSALILLGTIAYWHLGTAIHITASSLAPHWSLRNAIFWSTVFFAFAGMESGSAMGDEIRNPRRTIPLAIVAGGSIMAIGYIAGTAVLLVTLPGAAVSGPDGLVNGLRVLSTRLGAGWLLAPLALLAGLNGVGGAATFLSSTSRLPFVVGIDRYLPSAFGAIHPRFKTPWIAIAIYGLAGICVAILGQAGTSVRGAYDVLVGMAVLTEFLPFLFIFGALIRVQSIPADSGVRRVPGGRPVAIALGVLGLASTAVTVALSTIPAEDDPDPTLAVVKILGATAVLIGAGVLVFAVARLRQKRGAHC